MGDKYPLNKVTLRYQGVFDFDGLYAAVIGWAKNYGYMWHEVDYKHKVPTPDGAEQEMKWILTKNVTDYVSYSMDINIHFWDMKEPTIEIKGKKKSVVSAKVEIIINGLVITDWQKKFKGGKIVSKLGQWYELLVTKDIESVYYDTLYYRTWNLHAIMKKYFDMQSKKYEYKGYLGES